MSHCSQIISTDDTETILKEIDNVVPSGADKQMTDETATTDKTEDGDNIKKPENETKEPKRTVSFNRDVHVKRFGKPRERGTSKEPPPSTRKEPFSHLSEQELIDEANKVLAQADSVDCTSDNPEKFYSLPHRRKKEDRDRRSSDDTGDKKKSPLERSNSDVGSKKKKERTSISTLFRRAQKTKSPDAPVVVATKPAVIVKRSKSDVSDLKSNTNLNTPTKHIRKRSGSETEEFLKSLRNKKCQLSPIIESSPREDYFKKTSPLELLQKQTLSQKDSVKSEEQTSSESSRVNPIEKPPRYKAPDKKEPKPPARSKKAKSSDEDKERSPPIKETPKRKTEVKKSLLVDEIDSIKAKDINPVEVKDRIKESIRKIEENIYADKDMIHSSQQPPDKPPLTRGNTVDHMVKILKEEQHTPPPKTHLIAPTNGTNINQPFSYTKPSTSPDPNLFVRNTSPDRVPSPVNKMANRGVVYAHVVRDLGDTRSNNVTKQTVHKTFTPPRDRHGQFSDEDEGLGYEERHKFSNNRMYEYDYKNNGVKPNKTDGYKIIDSPIRPKFREYKLTSFDDIEPTYANEYNEDKSRDFIKSSRGRADGMDTKRKPFEAENKVDLDFNELSHRRQLLESRLNARRLDREKSNLEEPITKYIVETDPIYEAEKRRLATEKYVNETAKYYRHTVERDGFAESSITEDYNKYDSDNHRLKYNTESRTFHKLSKNELERREFIDKADTKKRFVENRNGFPPEPEYEPPSLEFNATKPVLTPDEYKEHKYRIKKHLTSSHDVIQSGHKYRKDDGFGKRKGHYASNPEIAQKREEDYANLRYDAKHAESYHNSLRRMKNKDKHYKDNYGIHRHDSGDSRDYYRDETPRRYDIDNRLVDSGIENDFRKDSSGEIHRSRRRHESVDDVRNTSMFLASERQHTEDNYPSEQIYANGEYLARFDYRPEGYMKEYVPRERSADDGSHFEPRVERYEKSSSRDDKVSAKPPKATKKLSGLEKMKQLFSRDSSKKSKKEKEIQPKARTRVLKSPEHLVGDDSDYRRYTDPEPSEIEVRKTEYEPKEQRRYDYKDERKYEKDERRYRGSRENLDRYKPSENRDSDPERKYKETELEKSRYERTLKEERKYQEHREARRYNSSDRESELRPSDEDRRRTKSRTAGPPDSPALAERYRERRRLATPSPTPSPPRRPPPANTGWLKSLDRLSRKKKNTKVEKETVLTEDRKYKPAKPINSPAKNLRFFGDTDVDSDAAVKNTVTKSKSHPQAKTHGTLRKTISNSSTGIDELDHAELTNKSHSLSNLREEKSESPRTKQYYKRNLHNISETHSNSENDSQLKVSLKPPMSPYDRSRSHSSSKTLTRNRRPEERGSSSELRSSKQELNRDYKPRRRTPAHSGESSTEGDSSHQSQRSVVYLHATTVGDIPDPGRVTRNRSRDDVSSVNSSNLQVRSTQKSFSIFAPWTPRHYNDPNDVYYEQRPRKPKPKEPFNKSSSTKNLSQEKPAALQKNKSYSQSTLTRKPINNRLTSSNTTLHRKPEKRGNSTMSRTRDGKRSQSSEVLTRDSRDKVSRSISMPKDEKKAGWFKLSNKKKQENTRVR